MHPAITGHFAGQGGSSELHHQPVVQVAQHSACGVAGPTPAIKVEVVPVQLAGDGTVGPLHPLGSRIEPLRRYRQPWSHWFK